MTIPRNLLDVADTLTNARPIHIQGQFGVSENAEWRCFVYEEDEHILTHWQLAAIPLAHELERITCFQAVKFEPEFAMVRPVPARYIWRKSLWLPDHYSPQQIYKQVIQQLRQLPVPLTDIYFDYRLRPHPQQQAVQVMLYALRQTFADRLCLPKVPTLLDCEGHCYLRAFHFLNPELDLERGYFQIAHRSVQLDPTGKGLRIDQPPLPNSPHYSLHDLDLDPHRVLDKSLYLLALGAYLWNGTGSI